VNIIIVEIIAVHGQIHRQQGRYWHLNKSQSLLKWASSHLNPSTPNRTCP